MDLIVKIKFGSHLYGTNTPQSDVDYKSVYLPTARDIVLQRVINSVHIGAKSKVEGERNLPTDVDNEAYSLQRYLTLLAEGQTVAIDMLFAPEPLLSTGLWDIIQNNRERLLTKRSAAFVGYCRTQANKYGIKGSRVASAKVAADFFEKAQSEHGTNIAVGYFFDSCNPANPFVVGERVLDIHTSIVTKETTNGSIESYFVCCNRMVGFKNTVKEAAALYRHIYESYGNRARQAECNEGIDWKALSHAVRVGNKAIELLNTHSITFPLPNASPHPRHQAGQHSL